MLTIRGMGGVRRAAKPLIFHFLYDIHFVNDVKHLKIEGNRVLAAGLAVGLRHFAARKRDAALRESGMRRPVTGLAQPGAIVQTVQDCVQRRMRRWSSLAVWSAIGVLRRLRHSVQGAGMLRAAQIQE